MLIRSLLLFSFLSIAAIAAQAQATCKCTDGGDTATASCSDGSAAICNCMDNLCNSRCVKQQTVAAKRIDASALILALKNTNRAGIANVLSGAFGKTVTFAPSENFKFDYAPSKLGSSTQWDVLDFLSTKGKMTIDGLGIDTWKSMRANLLSGSEMTISMGGGTVQTMLNELSFMSGKRFSITEGNSAAVITNTIKGKGITELISELSKAGKVTIVEN